MRGLSGFPDRLACMVQGVRSAALTAPTSSEDSETDEGRVVWVGGVLNHDCQTLSGAGVQERSFDRTDKMRPGYVGGGVLNHDC